MSDLPVARQKTADYNLGDFTFPRGWFQIASVSDLDGNKPMPIRYFAKDFILYRGESGRLVLVDAYCAHMQTHLCKNTTSYIMRDNRNIEGDSIRCPYHAWRFGPDGKCDDIPYYDGAIPKAAKIGSYPVQERYGIIYMWHDPEGGQPDYDLPEIAFWDDPSWVKWRIDDLGVIATHPIEILDNMEDVAHVGPTHGGMLEYFRNEYKDHVVVQYQGGRHRMAALASDRIDLVTWYTGPGLLLSRMVANYDSLMFINNTPVEDGVTRVWTGLMVKTTDGAAATQEDIDRAAGYQDAGRISFEQDFDIWANKAPCKQVLQLPTDGPYIHGRRWYSQFYRPRADVAPIWQKSNGIVFTKGKPPMVPESRTLGVPDAGPFLLWQPEGPGFENFNAGKAKEKELA